MLQSRVGEIEIRRYIVNDRSEPSMRDVEAKDWHPPFVFADEVTARIAALEAAGVRVLFVPVEGPGGHIHGALRIFEALRAFSDRGGFVVVSLCGERVASCAPFVGLAGDLIVASPEAKLLLHGPYGATPEVLAKFVARLLEIARDRTVMPPGGTEACLEREGVDDQGLPRAMLVMGEEITKNGWADAVGSESDARGAAEFIAAEATGVPKRHEPGGQLHRLRGMQSQRAGRFVVTERVVDLPPVDLGEPGGPPACHGIHVEETATGSITAAKLSADAIQTTDYAEDANGAPLEGAKLDHRGTALKVAAGNFQIGSRNLNNLGLMAAGAYVLVNSNDTYSLAPARNLNFASVARQLMGTSYGLRLTFSQQLDDTKCWVLLTTRSGGGALPYDVRWHTMSATYVDVLVVDASGSQVDPNTVTTNFAFMCVVFGVAAW